MKLYVIRHGRTPWNEKGLMQGRVNIKLSETGKKEAKKKSKHSLIYQVYKRKVKRYKL